MRQAAGVLTLSLLCMPAAAQTLHGLTVGEALLPALKRMPKTQNIGPAGHYAAIKWPLPGGDSFSATAAPDTGKIVLLEEDRDPASATYDVPAPGLILGATTLADIRRRFGSNGIGFASNAESLQAGALIGINCYELRHAPGVFVAFVTRLVPPRHKDRAPTHIDTGAGVLVSIIVAEKSYLEEIWGDDLLFDHHYKPIDVPGLLAAN